MIKYSDVALCTDRQTYNSSISKCQNVWEKYESNLSSLAARYMIYAYTSIMLNKTDW